MHQGEPGPLQQLAPPVHHTSPLSCNKPQGKLKQLSCRRITWAAGGQGSTEGSEQQPWFPLQVQGLHIRLAAAPAAAAASKPKHAKGSSSSSGSRKGKASKRLVSQAVRAAGYALPHLQLDLEDSTVELEVSRSSAASTCIAVCHVLHHQATWGSSSRQAHCSRRPHPKLFAATQSRGSAEQSSSHCSSRCNWSRLPWTASTHGKTPSSNMVVHCDHQFSCKGGQLIADRLQQLTVHTGASAGCPLGGQLPAAAPALQAAGQRHGHKPAAPAAAPPTRWVAVDVSAWPAWVIPWCSCCILWCWLVMRLQQTPGCAVLCLLVAGADMDLPDGKADAGVTLHCKL